MGRPRAKAKDLPLGVYARKSGDAVRYYVFPVNEEMRRVFAARFPGKSSHPLGSDKNAMRKEWAAIFATDAKAAPTEDGTVAELIARYERDVVPGMHEKTKAEHERYCRNLKAGLGHWRYAKSEAEAATGKFLRSMHVTQYLRTEGKKPGMRKGKKVSETRYVAVNKEVQCLSRIFHLAKVEWGSTEYNPCLQVEYNGEAPRSVYVTDGWFMRVYEKASDLLQCMMDLAQMHGARRGMLLKATLACITDEGLLLPINKKKAHEPQRYQLIKWNDDLRAVVDRWLALRAKIRGAKADVLEHPHAPLFLNRGGKAVSETGFNSMWQRANRAAGFHAHEFHFHDIKAKAVSDSPDEIDAMNRGAHTDLRTTRTVYRRKPTVIVPLPRVSKKAG